ncbi:oxysterol binding protein-like protein [Dothidotthia symphoricarpi CBS 119687]|uniref:Oxysterol binding protein-like protein n=1 Tax=Dothidotthia symphoricarpi CBS 119687 TaxID=1392245 RepID=A0A6A6AQ15_9PLEO|nr:oxysterol binding protein-like protein [Dothidotthia symphoricarpi CBS 119687]KAF2133105.1 oxysterol binding protein-like protein [Dothidotthia symphoricarpi CBS 119687]
MAEKEGSAVPAQSKGSWSSFLKSIASFNGDLSSMTAPAFILSTTSLTEFSSYWTEHPSIFVAPAAEKDPAKRAVLVLKWFLSTLKQQYASRSEKLGSEKKPLNPFLGELFLGKWEDAAGTTQLVSEQVSHHPPVTAYSIWNNQHGVRLQGYNAQKASFKTTINVKQIGHAMLHLDAFNEDYLITLPSLHIEGLISGSPFVELNGSTYIQSSSGYTSRIDYSGKGWVSGKKNTFSAVVYPDGREKEKLYTAEGQWSDAFQIKDHKTKTVIAAHDHKVTKPTQLFVAAVEQQDDLETRRAWKKVADAIVKGDMDKTSYEKTIIENRQREMRKQEKEAGHEWERTFFTRSASNPLFERLAGKVGEKVNDTLTNGVWIFDEKKASTATSPFHPEVQPPIYELKK